MHIAYTFSRIRLSACSACTHMMIAGVLAVAIGICITLCAGEIYAQLARLFACNALALALDHPVDTCNEFYTDVLTHNALRKCTKWHFMHRHTRNKRVRLCMTFPTVYFLQLVTFHHSRRFCRSNGTCAGNKRADSLKTEMLKNA